MIFIVLKSLSFNEYFKHYIKLYNLKMTENFQLIENKLDKETKKFENLEKSLMKILENEKEIKEIRMKSNDIISKLEEENVYLKEISNLYVRHSGDVEISRDNKISKLEKTILPAVKYYPQKIKELKKPLNQVKDICKSINKHSEKITDAKKTNDMRTATIHENDLQKDQKDKVKNVEDLEKKFLDLEKERVEDSKAVFLHLIHSEISYHANALQSLSKLYQEISCRDPKEKLRDFINFYKLNTLTHVNLEERYDFVNGSTQKRIEEINNQQNNIVKEDGNINISK